jgi:hypothetical protein
VTIGRCRHNSAVETDVPQAARGSRRAMADPACGFDPLPYGPLEGATGHVRAPFMVPYLENPAHNERRIS